MISSICRKLIRSSSPHLARDIFAKLSSCLETPESSESSEESEAEQAAGGFTLLLFRTPTLREGDGASLGSLRLPERGFRFFLFRRFLGTREGPAESSSLEEAAEGAEGRGEGAAEGGFCFFLFRRFLGTREGPAESSSLEEAVEGAEGRGEGAGCRTALPALSSSDVRRQGGKSTAGSKSRFFFFRRQTVVHSRSS